MGKLCGSLCISCLGVVMYWGSLALLAVNEQRTVCTQRAFISAANVYEEVSCDGRAGGADLRNSAIFFSCPFAEESLVSRGPNDFGAKDFLGEAFRVKAVKVRQDVQMLQCVETKTTEQRKEGDRTIQVDRYSYDLQWRSGPVDATSFRAWSSNAARDALRDGCGAGFHSNPNFKLSSQTLMAPSLISGVFDLTRFLSQLDVSEAIPLKGGMGAPRRTAKDGQPYTWEEFEDYYQDSAWREWRAAAEAEPDGFLEGNVLHTCNYEKLGCLRISYFKSSATHGSYLGSQRLGRSPVRTLPWKAPPSWMCKATDVDLFSGKEYLQSAEDLLREAERSNRAMTWLCRLLGAVAAVLGIWMFLSPIHSLVEIVEQFFHWFRVLPLLGDALGFLGSVVSGAVGCALLALALSLGLPSAMLVVSVSWCVMRPILGIPMLLCSLFGLALGLRKLFRAAKVKTN